MTTQQSVLLALGAALILWLISALQPILMPFLVAALFAYLGDPWADRLEAWGLSRNWAVIICFSALTFVLMITLFLLVPALFSQTQSLFTQLPSLLETLHQEWLPKILSFLGLEEGLFGLDSIKNWLVDHWGASQEALTNALKHIGASSAAFFAFIANIALIPVVAFYLLRDWDILVQKTHSLFPRKIAPRIGMLAKECDEVLGAFLRGQLLVMMALGGIYAIGLSLIGLKYSLLIGVVAGLASIVPYLGFVVGIAVASVTAFFQFHLGWELALVALVFGIGQAIEGMVLTPWLVGDRIGLHPVAVIFAILAGGQLFGMVGVLLALPVGAVIMVLLRHVHDNYKESEFYGASMATEPIEIAEPDQMDSDREE